MKQLMIAATAATLLASSASASSLAFNLPTLTFPPADSVTSQKTCIQDQTQTTVCIEEE